MGTKRMLYDCLKESVILASSHAKEYPPELVVFDDSIDLKINKCSTRKPPDLTELEISEDEEELPNLYNRLGNINFATFWQSCGTTPHEISFQFKRQIEAQKIEVWVSRVHRAFLLPRNYSPFSAAFLSLVYAVSNKNN
ncbi:hypothetical protein DSO57_1033665 [Entomophthora muscae]|uniref:Uncharacterized protein n=1 Tax=Entomophthora muscae TaxID=34485 RepID=A0ACC2SD01_9FUNG|nr:hypothetical protein DSO57_1033665 [Entomophthora muscae]